MTTQRLCAVGYASLDHKFRTRPFEGIGRTTLVERTVHQGETEPGAVAYFAQAAARQGWSTDVVTWVGDDHLGSRFTESLGVEGVNTRGISRGGARTPSTYMFYPAGQEGITFYDAGEVDARLTETQCDVLAEADAVILGICAEQSAWAALKEIDDEVTLMWAVKGDTQSMTPELAGRLAERAQVITYSASEIDFLRTHCKLPLEQVAHRGNLVVETHGSAGVQYYLEGEPHNTGPVQPLVVADQTGAGDTFAGSLMVRIVQAGGLRCEDPHTQVVEACHDVARFLAERETRETDV